MASKLFIVSSFMLVFLALTIYGCSQKKSTKTTMSKEKETACSDDCTAKNKVGQLTCKLTTPELRKRKETVIASLKQQIIEKKELKNGFAFKFLGTDKVLDELTEFIKTERACCDFITFGLSISGDKSEAWLELAGADGTKDFIKSELGLTD
jgi:hypothetical protein